MTKIIKEFRNKYRFLSNFFPVRIEIDGMEYATTEHYFQSVKFLEPEISEIIRTASTPGQAKKLARKYKSHVRADWYDISLGVMETALRAKFSLPEYDFLNKLILTKQLQSQPEWTSSSRPYTYNHNSF